MGKIQHRAPMIGRRGVAGLVQRMREMAGDPRRAAAAMGVEQGRGGDLRVGGVDGRHDGSVTLLRCSIKIGAAGVDPFSRPFRTYPARRSRRRNPLTKTRYGWG